MTERIIGFLTPMLDGAYFGQILKSIRETAKEQNVKLLVIGTNAENYQTPYGLDFVDGWIVLMDAVDQRYIDKLKKRNKPVIGINTMLQCDNYVHVDNEDAIETLLEHLIKHHYTNFAYIGDYVFFDAKKRYYAFQHYLNQKGLLKEPYFFDSITNSPSYIVDQILHSDIHYDALICVNDFVAYNIIRELKKRDVRVPEEIAVVGFDNSYATRFTQPMLTTVNLPVNEIGKEATLLTLNEMEGKKSSPAMITTQIVLRHSCGCEYNEFSMEDKDPSDTFDYLTNLVSRNFNLGNIMQSYLYKDLIEMKWLLHTPYRKGFILLNEENHFNWKMYYFNVEQIGKEEFDWIANIEKKQFPTKEQLLNKEIFQDENTMVIIPIILDEIEIGTLGFVGVDDETSMITPLNTTYQLGNFFASALKRARMDQDLKAYSHKLELISTIIYDGIWELDLTTDKVTSTGGIHKILGYTNTDAEISFYKLVHLIHKDDIGIFYQSYRNGLETGDVFDIECRMRHVEGHYLWMFITGQPESNLFGEMTKVIGSIMDISEKKTQENQIQELIYKDSLTQIHNRLYFNEQLNKLLKVIKEEQKKLALIMFDLDQFKSINDTFGHTKGDEILLEVAVRVSDLCVNHEVFCRLGGDEFVIIMPDINTIDDVITFSEQIRKVIEMPFFEHFFISTSIGISLYPNDAICEESLTIHADKAMYQSKKNGGNQISVYS